MTIVWKSAHGEIGMSKKVLSLVAAGLTVVLASTGAHALPLAALPSQDGVVHRAQYIYEEPGYHRHRHHHGHVHGNPHRPHLDCRFHGDHEHCRVHVPRRYYNGY
jgi:hypothetical protein